MPWPWGTGAINKSSKRANRRARRAVAKHDAGLLFETLEPRVLLNAAPFATVAQPQPIAQENGTQLFATLTGAGHIQVSQTQGGGEALTITGTTATSSLVLTVKGGTAGQHFLLNSIDIAGPMNSITASGVDLQGQFVANGPLHFVSLGNAQNSTFTASGPIDSLNLGIVRNTMMSVNGAIGDFELNSWISTGAPNKLTAASINVLHATGDFDASLALSGPTGNHGAPTLGLANIGGTLADGLWYIVGDTGLVMTGQVA